MSLLFFNANQILTCKAQNKRFKRKDELSELSKLEKHSIIVDAGIITEITDKVSEADFDKFDNVIDVSNHSILPGLVDAHTHLVFTGSREEEFEKRTKGISYEEIARSGGGINSTVEAIRKIQPKELLKKSKKRLLESISYGITTIEIKSGYGLDVANEIKMLNCIKELNELDLAECIPTFLGAHTVPNEFKQIRANYISLITDQMLPKISQLGVAKYCDIFLEATAFSVEESELILSKAKSLGFELKLHCDQFNSIDRKSVV